VAAGLDEAERRQPMAPAETSSIRQPVAAPVVEEIMTVCEAEMQVPPASNVAPGDVPAGIPGEQAETEAAEFTDMPAPHRGGNLPEDPDRPVVIPRPTLTAALREQPGLASQGGLDRDTAGTPPSEGPVVGSVRDQTERIERSFREAATSGFASLFMKRRTTPQAGNDIIPYTPSASSTPAAAGQDDPELEIPAFLRRSANN
jgi:cell division protein FtsZ